MVIRVREALPIGFLDMDNRLSISLLLLVIFSTSITIVSTRLFANPGCAYTNTINSAGQETGFRGNQSVEYDVTLTLYYKENLIQIPIKMCL